MMSLEAFHSAPLPCLVCVQDCSHLKWLGWPSLSALLSHSRAGLSGAAAGEEVQVSGHGHEGSSVGAEVTGAVSKGRIWDIF